MPTTPDTAIAGSAIDDLPQIWDGFAKLVRAGLDIRAFGGPEGLRVLCVGGVPGEPYVAPEWTV
jgi:hypothetical protein